MVLTLGSRIVVMLNDGRTFAHDVSGNTFAPVVQLAQNCYQSLVASAFRRKLAAAAVRAEAGSHGLVTH